jgi:hypothetical protein
VAVENATYRVAHGLIAVVSFHEHAEQPGNRPLSGTRPGTLQEPRQLGKDGWRIASRRRGFACRQIDLAQRQREPRDAVHQAEDIETLIPQRFGNRQGQVSGPAPEHGRQVRRRDDDDAAAAPFHAQRVLQELADLPAAFANQPDDQSISVRLLRDHGKKGRLADA